MVHAAPPQRHCRTSLSHFAPLFSLRTWRHVPILVLGAGLAPGRRMVSSAVRTVGLAHRPTFQTDHRLLNRAVWSSLGASRILLHLLVATFAATGPLVLGIDETTWALAQPEDCREWHLPRSRALASTATRVKVNGLRWICRMLLVPVPWAARVWALPFLTTLAPSERSAQERDRRHTSIATWARQLIRLVHRWLPDRQQAEECALYPAVAKVMGLLTMATDAQRATVLAAGQALLTNWQGTAFDVAYFLGAVAALIIAAVMLRSTIFGKATASAGLFMGALAIVPATAGTIGIVFSLVSLVPTVVWLILIGRRLFQLGQRVSTEEFHLA